MKKEELDRLIAAVTARGLADADAQYDGVADDGFEIARAMLQVLGRRLGLSFVLEVQREVLKRAEEYSQDADPHRRADAVEILAVANAGYFEDLIEGLVEREKSGNA